jgi:hypothetical protein
MNMSKLICTTKISNKQKAGLRQKDLLKISAAVSRSLGSCRSILLTKSFALLEIDGQGSDEKSIWPLRTASNIPSSFSGKTKGEE